jgi:hypothetical protein
VEYLEVRTLLSQFWVTNLNDSGGGSLRQAIVDSNKTTGPNEIDFAVGLSGTITLTSGELMIAKNDLKIIGPGQNSLIVSGNGNSRVFEVASGVSVSLSGMTITGGEADNGGGIYNAGMLTIGTSSISGNSAVWSGGGIDNSGTVTIAASTVSDNSAGGYYLGDPDDPSVIPSSSGGTGGGIANLGTLTIDACTLSGNSVKGYWLRVALGRGGAIYNGGFARIAASTISGNYANAEAGGIDNSGTVTIAASTISGNQGAGSGGGINNNSGTVTIAASTISDNHASYGGGICNYGGNHEQPGTVTISASTISGNSAGNGGGICNGHYYFPPFGKVTIVSSTISGNSASNGAGVYIEPENQILGAVATVMTAMSLFDNPAGGNLVVGDGATFVSLGHNLFSDAPATALDPTDLVNTDPLLGPLADNGGPTMTMALLPGSPAIDAGSNDSVPAGVQYDQRGPGFQRIVNGTVDIGAFEWQPYVASFIAFWGSQTAPLQLAADGLRLLPAGRNTDLPWLNINQLTITLSTAEPLTPADIIVSSTSHSDYGPVTLSGSGTDCTIMLSQPITVADRVTIKLNLGGMVAPTFELDVLPGDVNDDGIVNAQDMVLIRNVIQKTGDPLMIGWADVDGLGGVNLTDYIVARKKLGSRLT